MSDKNDVEHRFREVFDSVLSSIKPNALTHDQFITLSASACEAASRIVAAEIANESHDLFGDDGESLLDMFSNAIGKSTLEDEGGEGEIDE